jgi:hypothetical protein
MQREAMQRELLGRQVSSRLPVALGASGCKTLTGARASGHHLAMASYSVIAFMLPALP